MLWASLANESSSTLSLSDLTLPSKEPKQTILKKQKTVGAGSSLRKGTIIRQVAGFTRNFESEFSIKDIKPYLPKVGNANRITNALTTLEKKGFLVKIKQGTGRYHPTIYIRKQKTAHQINGNRSEKHLVVGGKAVPA